VEKPVAALRQSTHDSGNLSHPQLILMRWVLCAAILVSVWMLLTSFTCLNLPGTQRCTNVLFIGNSYTAFNNLPAIFVALSRAGGHKVASQSLSEGGWTLAEHASAAETLSALNSRPWDYVILQEQSEIPAEAASREELMDPAARTLVNEIESTGSTPVFFLTWAHRDGLPAAGLEDYQAMQIALDQGYLEIARELQVEVAPVGAAWGSALETDPALTLWQADGSHPTPSGTYLAACVFYAVLFQESPLGLPPLAGISRSTARELQAAAENAVFTDPQQWNLP
jgi:hypothetical protein